MSKMIEVVTYCEDYQEDFARLNFAWIEQYFVIEEADRKYLLHPREKILTPGGQIFFVLQDGSVKGTCALLRNDETTYELAKMAVNPQAQGQGLASHLLQAAIDWAGQQQGRRIVLESNTKLSAAIKLYKKFGFRTTSLGPFEHSEYARVNIVMELDLESR